MSKEALIKVVQRSISDPGFRRQLAADASGALSGYDLTPGEIGALRSRDAGKLTAFGVDTRMSKVFTIEGGAIGNAYVVTGGPRNVEPVWIGEGAAHGAVQSPDAADRNMAYTDGTASASSGVQSPDAIDRNLAFTTTGSDPKDGDPIFMGDGFDNTQAHTFSGDDNPGPEIHDAPTGDGDLSQ